MITFNSELVAPGIETTQPEPISLSPEHFELMALDIERAFGKAKADEVRLSGDVVICRVIPFRFLKAGELVEQRRQTPVF